MIEVAVTTVAGILVIVNTIVANRARQHSKATRAQVENDHSTNLREEGDERHAENTGLLRDLLERISGVKSDIRGLRRDIGRLADADRTHEERIHELERTHPPRPKEKPHE